MLTSACQFRDAAQAGTPMTVTGEGTLSPDWWQGADLFPSTFFCLKISRGRRLVRHWFENQPARGSAPGARRQHEHRA